MGCVTPYQKYLRLANATVGLRGLDVLEVGGCTPPAFVAGYAPRRWTAIDLNPIAVTESERQAQELGLANYSPKLQDIATLESVNAFDRIYSINSFEHIKNLAGAFETMYRSLRQGGYLFALFGPIWGSDVGHHLSLATDMGELHFGDGVLEPWEHLTSSPEAILKKLEMRYGRAIADRAVEFIFDYPDMNRLFERDYIAIINSSGFGQAMILRNKRGRPPNISGATSTREFALVLKKGEVGIVERITMPVRFVAAYLRTRI